MTGARWRILLKPEPPAPLTRRDWTIVGCTIAGASVAILLVLTGGRVP